MFCIILTRETWLKLVYLRESKVCCCVGVLFTVHEKCVIYMLPFREISTFSDMLHHASSTMPNQFHKTASIRWAEEKTAPKSFRYHFFPKTMKVQRVTKKCL